MLKYLHIALLVLAANISFGQLKVTVLDKESGKPVPFAYVNVYKEPEHLLLYDKTQQTGDSGVINITIDKYPCTIEISGQGYETFKKYLPSQPDNKELLFPVTKSYSALNEVVVTGVTQPQRLKDALSLYQVIPKAAIQAMGAVTLDEVLKTQLNVDIKNDNILGSYMNMQGIVGNKVKILIDGVPINGKQNGSINFGQINMGNVERIEIIKGPMSVAYGTDAIAGVINIITKSSDKQFNLQANALYESVGKYNGSASVSFKIKSRNQITVGGGRNYFAGYQFIDTVWNSVKVPNNNIHRQMLYLPDEQYLGNFQYKYSAPSGYKLILASDYLNDKVINKGAIQVWDPFYCYAFDQYYYTTRLMNRLSMDGKIGKKGTWSSQNSFMLYDNRVKEVSTDLTTLNQELTTGKGDQDTTKFYDLTFRANYSNNYHQFGYTVGYDIHLGDAISSKIANRSKAIDDYALFQTLSYQVLKNILTVQGGIRETYNTVYKAPMTPSVNFLYTPIKKLQVRVSYAKGFRAPSLEELYLNFVDANHLITGNQNLKAEISKTFQASASYQLYEKQADYLQAIFTTSYNDVSNGIVLANTDTTNKTRGVGTYENMQKIQNSISNLQVDGQKGNFHFQTGYSLRYTFASPGKWSSFFVHEFNTNLQYKWMKAGLAFNIFYKFTGPQPVITPNSGDVAYSGHQDAYNLCDASIEKCFINKRLQIICGVKNLFNVIQPKTNGIVSFNPHGNGSQGNFLPRSFFTSLRLSID